MKSFRVYRLLLLPVLALLSVASSKASDLPTLPLSEDAAFNFELLFPLDQSTTGGGDISDVLGLAKRIEPGEFESYSTHFHALANRTKSRALDKDIAYDPVNVRDTWFSAATYFRRADFYLHGNWDDPRSKILWAEQTAAFDNAIKSLPVPGERVQIQADNFTVEGIWYASSSQRSKRATLIVGNGYDASQEDSYHSYVVDALARGWNCFTYEGPGQGIVRRNQNIGFIPDWERVVTPVVDYVLSELSDSVDPTRLVLLGNSMGGYLAARAAAFEPRLSAVILNGGVWDLFAAYSAQLPPALMQIFESGNQSVFDAAVRSALADTNASTTVRWGTEQGLWSFHTTSALDFLKKTQDFRLKGVVDKIQIPVFIADAEFESFFPDQSVTLRNALGPQATLHTFNGTSGYHCQIGAGKERSSVIFGWLNKVLRRQCNS